MPCSSVISVGTIHGGTRMNIVPEKVEMIGTVRTYDEAMKKDIHARIKRTTEAIAASAGAEADFRVVELYNATINQPALTEKMAPTLQRVAGDDRAQEERIGGLLVLPGEGAWALLLPGCHAQGPGCDQGAPQPLSGVLCG
jgi:metal-dependent amidase/aminoacylase/carboxypeptidase family protein